jgi:threonine aldolase
MRSFASDNNAGVHPRILEAIAAVNVGHVVAYGDDPYTAGAIAKFKEHLGQDIDVYFVFGGTSANVLGLKTVTESHNAVICAETAHIYVDECGAPENFIGCKLLPLVTKDGKLTVEQIEPFLKVIGNEHHVQPRVISISQVTEMGTVYTPAEIERLARFGHDNGLLLHMDGARIANAAASLNCSLRDITTDAGVDVLSFGGTKNGILGGEAVVFFHPELGRDFLYLRKQSMQLASKMRFIAAQFEALLTNDVWRRSAEHANRMARLLEKEISRIPGVKVVWKVEANGVFVRIPRDSIEKIKQHYFFYTWIEEESIVRWMCSFDTTEDDIRKFAEVVSEAVKG